jgi:hypothetical protein
METTTSAFDIPVNYILGRCTFGNWDDDDEEAETTLSVLNVSYVVKERIGPWWKGACFRRIKHKVVLRDASMHMKSGQITAILGGSGIYTLFVENISSFTISIFFSNLSRFPSQIFLIFCSLQNTHNDSPCKMKFFFADK